MTPPPPRHFQYPVPPCVYEESRARAYAGRQRRQRQRQAGRRQATQLQRQRQFRQRRQRGSGSGNGSATATATAGGSGANGNGGSGRQYKAAKRGKNARKHASRINTQPQAQTPLKTRYTASAVQFTQTAAPTHEKTVVVWHNNTAVVKQHKNAKLSAKHTKTQKCTRKKACNTAQAVVL